MMGQWNIERRVPENKKCSDRLKGDGRSSYIYESHVQTYVVSERSILLRLETCGGHELSLSMCAQHSCGRIALYRYCGKRGKQTEQAVWSSAGVSGSWTLDALHLIRKMTGRLEELGIVQD